MTARNPYGRAGRSDAPSNAYRRFRCTEEEAAELDARAAASDESFSNWARKVLLSERNKPKKVPKVPKKVPKKGRGKQ